MAKGWIRIKGVKSIDVNVLEDLDQLDSSEDESLAREVLVTYLSVISGLVAQIEAAVGQNDLATASFSAHKLKSSSSSIGAYRLARLCKILEDVVHEEITLLRTSALSEEIRQESSSVIGEIKFLLEQSQGYVS